MIKPLAASASDHGPDHELRPPASPALAPADPPARAAADPHTLANSPDPFADPALRGPGLLASLREAFGRARRPLDVIQVEVTSRCPGRCAYCPKTTMADVWKARHMAPQTYVALWPLLRQTNRVHLQGWGEPLLHPRFLDMAALARRAGCQVSTTTCGLVMNEELAVSLVSSGIDVIAFSLTGATPESNNAARPGVDFAAVAENIRLLDRVRRTRNGVHLELHLAYLMLAGAIDEVLLLPDLMRELGVHAAVVSTLDYLPSPEWAMEAFVPDPRDAASFAEKLVHARAVLAEAASRAGRLGLDLHYSLPMPTPAPRCLENPDRSLYVDAEGTLAPCIYLNLPTSAPDPERREFGSCQGEDPLLQWQGPEFTAFRKTLAEGSPQGLCVRCPKRFAHGNRDG